MSTCSTSTLSISLAASRAQAAAQQRWVCGARNTAVVRRDLAHVQQGWTVRQHGLLAGQPTRRGVMLLDTVVAITVASLVVGMGAVLLGQMLRGEAQAREHVHRLTALGRLSARLREDANRAARVVLPRDALAEIAPEAPQAVHVLRLVLAPGEQIDYLAQPDGLHRVARVSGGVQRERYILPSRWSCALQVEQQAHGRWLILTLRVPPAAGQSWQGTIEAPLSSPPEQPDAENMP